MDDDSVPSRVSQILFKAFANPKRVNFDRVREVPLDARFPPVRAAGDAPPPTSGLVAPASSPSAAPSFPSPSSDESAATALAMLAQARALGEAARATLESAARLFPEAVESARGRIGWPRAPVARVLESSSPRADAATETSPRAGPGRGPAESTLRVMLPSAWTTGSKDVDPDDDDDRCELAIRRFDPKRIGPGRVHLIVGKRRTGKHTLLKDVISRMGHGWDCVAGMSAVPESRKAMEEIIPASCVYDGYDPDAIERVVKALHRLCHEREWGRAALILDGCLFDSRMVKSMCMRDIHMNGRHLRLDVFIVCPRLPDLPKALRAFVDYVYAFREPKEEHRRGLYRNFFGVFETCQQFTAALDACTEGHGCMVLDNAVRSDRVEDVVSWYRADPSIAADEAIWGSHDQWLLHHMFYENRAVCIGGGIPALARPAARSDV
jgi:hypothetical protein